jgi:hypothetical protein
MKHLNFFELFGLSGAFLLISTQNAHAYLDPGTGSYTLQILVAVFVGAFYAIKVYWSKIKAFFSKSKEIQDDGK